MPPATIESLPTELLQDISEILDIIHPPSLLAFACASKHCYAVASTVLFRTVKVTIAVGTQRFQDACELEKRLLRDNAFGHVRRIIFFSDREDIRYPYLSLHPSERDREDDTEFSAEDSLTPYERTLVTCPLLYSLGDLKTLRLVRGDLFTGSTRVYFWWMWRGTEVDAAAHNTETPIPVPRELIQVDGRRNHSPIPFDIVYKEAAGDLSSLRALKLNVPLAPQELPVPNDLPSLRTLTFTCVVSSDSNPPHYWDEVTNLLRNLPHLTTLQIRRWNREISFIPCLSPNLRRLDLGTTLAPNNARLRDDHIHQLAEICPNLEHPTIEIRRSRGDAAEVARYKSLGRLPRLQKLHIVVDASPPGYVQSVSTAPDGSSTTTIQDTAIEPWFDEQDARYLPKPVNAYREGHVRDLFVSNAIDASLARSIFRLIDGAKPKRSPGWTSTLPLERLELHPRKEERFVGKPSIESNLTPLNSKFLTALKRDWRVERDVRDDSREVLHVSEIRNAFSDLAYLRRFKPKREPEYWFNLWRRVWPVEREGIDWWDDWESYPLALEDDGSVNGG